MFIKGRSETFRSLAVPGAAGPALDEEAVENAVQPNEVQRCEEDAEQSAR